MPPYVTLVEGLPYGLAVALVRALHQVGIRTDTSPKVIKVETGSRGRALDILRGLRVAHRPYNAVVAHALPFYLMNDLCALLHDFTPTTTDGPDYAIMVPLAHVGEAAERIDAYFADHLTP